MSERRGRNLKVVGGLALAAGLLGTLTLSGAFRGGATGVEVGDHVPAFSAPNLSGEQVSFADLRGQVVLVNIWATWCAPCRVEMPPIQRAYERFRDRGFSVLAVSIDTGPGHREVVARFAGEYGLDFPLLLDPEGRITRVLQTVGVPETFVLDREGRIVKRLIGATDWDSPGNQALIQELLRM